MPKLDGFFDEFPDLEQIKAENLVPMVGNTSDIKLLENRLGNKILYPYTIPTTPEETLFEQAVIVEAVKVHAGKFYKPGARNIYLPEKLYRRYQSGVKLALLFVQALQPTDMITLILQIENDGILSLGTYLRPRIVQDGVVYIFINDQKYEIKTNSLVQLAANKVVFDIKFQSDVATLFGQSTFMAEIKGGSLGVIVDTRK